MRSRIPSTNLMMASMECSLESVSNVPWVKHQKANKRRRKHRISSRQKINFWHKPSKSRNWIKSYSKMIKRIDKSISSSRQGKSNHLQRRFPSQNHQESLEEFPLIEAFLAPKRPVSLIMIATLILHTLSNQGSWYKKFNLELKAQKGKNIPKTKHTY